MKIFMAGTSSHKYVVEEHKNDYILESFYSIKEWQIPYIKECKMFLLDSGAFTFMNNNKGKIDFNQYLKDYINFINKYDIKYFFELDIDSIVGHEKVKEMRAVLEKETGKKCIPESMNHMLSKLLKMEKEKLKLTFLSEMGLFLARWQV